MEFQFKNRIWESGKNSGQVKKSFWITWPGSDPIRRKKSTMD
jgi:hypothetical protein